MKIGPGHRFDQTTLDPRLRDCFSFPVDFKGTGVFSEFSPFQQGKTPQ
jgi:hypothetical protein